MRPLASHPELSVIIPAPGVIEFRVENWWLRNGGKKVPRDGPGLGDFIFTACYLWAWLQFGFPKSLAHLCPWLCAISLYFYSKCTRLIYESLIILPQHGIQLESHRGVKPPFFRALPLTAHRRFIPLTSVRDVVINEGLRRWDVRYYICIIRDTGSEVLLDVAYENILPHSPVLEFVYNEVHDFLQFPRQPAAPI